MIELKCVSKIYADDMEKILDDISLKIEKGECVAIKGKPGSGKTTLINIMGAMEKISSGMVEYNGNRTDWLKESEKEAIRISDYAFLYGEDKLIANLNVYDNIVFSQVFSKKIDKDNTIRIIEALELDKLLNKKAEILTKIDAKKVLMAKALSKKPVIIFADEPYRGLMSSQTPAYMRLLIDNAKHEGITLIYTTSDDDYAKMGDRTIEI